MFRHCAMRHPGSSLWRGGLCISDHFCRLRLSDLGKSHVSSKARFEAPLFGDPARALPGLKAPAGRRWASPRCGRYRRRPPRPSVYIRFGEKDVIFWCLFLRPLTTERGLFPLSPVFTRTHTHTRTHLPMSTPAIRRSPSRHRSARPPPPAQGCARAHERVTFPGWLLLLLGRSSNISEGQLRKLSNNTQNVPQG